MLENGLYEQLINQVIDRELNDDKKLIKTRKLSEEGSEKILSRYVAEVVELGLRSCGSMAEKIDLANNLIENIKNQTSQSSLSDYAIATGDGSDDMANELLSVSDKANNVQAVNDNIEVIRPKTSLVESSLFTGSDKEPKMFEELRNEIASADRIDMLVSFIRCAGVRLILKPLQKFTARGGRLRIITTSYMGVTEIGAVEELAKLPNTEVKICYETKNVGLHAKAYVFYRNTGFSTAYIGSSNISRKALSNGLEWNLKITRKDLTDTFDKVEETFEIYWNSSEFSYFGLDDREQLKKALEAERQSKPHIGADTQYTFDLRPYNYQQEILDRLDAERQVRGYYRNLVVAATGTGKTLVSAFDYRNFCRRNGGKYPRLLFVAHRKEILEQSLYTYRAVLKDANFGDLLIGTDIPEQLDHLFVSIQSFNSKKLTDVVKPDFYDYIVVDEFHHAAAPSYQELLDYFSPKILLGLTATPERMDGGDILKYFDYRIAADIRLTEAIDRGLLCPFQYFGVSDSVDLSSIKWTKGGYDKTELSNVYSMSGAIADRRADSIITNLKKYALDMSLVKGLGFCVSTRHAEFMAEFFNANGIKSLCLTAESSKELRDGAREKLVHGDITFIFVVDLYNEGVDIPEVNTVLFLRPTESLTVFLQQLGRGLRLAEGKDCLTVLDFIGQANKKYNFEDKFRALLTRTRKGIADEVKHSFPSVPKGCYISLEKKASEYVIKNISQSYSSRAGILSRIASFASDTNMEPTLTEFLKYYRLSPKVFYRYDVSFGAMLHVCGQCDDYEEVFSEKNWSRLAVIDSRRWIDFLLKFLPNAEEADFLSLSGEEKKMLRMFCQTLWDVSEVDVSSRNVSDNIIRICRNRVVLNEVLELLTYNRDCIDFVDEDVLADKQIPLDLHCTYSRDQILVAFDFLSPGSMREGVKYFDNYKTDVLLVTLEKNDKDYTPTTMYHDYSINENLFHWQSQSTTGSNSRTGHRYINHDSSGNSILLFVREAKKNGVTKKVEGYTFLGKAHYMSHTGSSPMNITWRLEKPIPSRFIRKTGKLLVG
ncbi:DUF3427 domain-containing protein [Ruminobacter sp.]|uniref:DEAD/DEAH box helicase n=1 Tax=Ruminobacter sp. TaxID=2774296 RepID=UPI00386D2321